MEIKPNLNIPTKTTILPIPTKEIEHKKILLLGGRFPKKSCITPSSLVFSYCNGDFEKLSPRSKSLGFKTREDRLLKEQEQKIYLHDLELTSKLGEPYDRLKNIFGAVLICHSNFQESLVDIKKAYEKIKKISPQSQVRVAVVVEGQSPNWVFDDLNLWAKEQRVEVFTDLSAKKSDVTFEQLHALFSTWSKIDIGQEDEPQHFLQN